MRRGCGCVCVADGMKFLHIKTRSKSGGLTGAAFLVGSPHIFTLLAMRTPRETIFTSHVVKHRTPNTSKKLDAGQMMENENMVTSREHQQSLN